MKELSIEEKARRYDKAIEKLRSLHDDYDTVSTLIDIKEELEHIFPELKESEDEKWRNWLIGHLKGYINQTCNEYAEVCKKAIAWLEKQGGQKPSMIQWKGNNLKEVIDFTGKDKNFDKWFKSFQEYEKYVSEHNNIFKLFNSDGSHFEVPVGAWIVKTPDGYNVASKYRFVQTPIEWSEEDERMYKAISIALSLKDAKGYLRTWSTTPEEADNWLKHLKERYAWKPSNEQMKQLKNAANIYPDSRLGYGLKTLYEDLKKLMEE